MTCKRRGAGRVLDARTGAGGGSGVAWADQAPGGHSREALTSPEAPFPSAPGHERGAPSGGGSGWGLKTNVRAREQPLLLVSAPSVRQPARHSVSLSTSRARVAHAFTSLRTRPSQVGGPRNHDDGSITVGCVLVNLPRENGSKCWGRNVC